MRNINDGDENVFNLLNEKQNPQNYQKQKDNYLYGV